MPTVRLARWAMACRFELVLHGDDAVRLRAAGEEALAEIDRLEDRLSFYRPSSDITRINARAADAPVPVSPRVFHLLQTARRLFDATGGAFDPTVGPLMRCWGFVQGSGHLPDPDALAAARRVTGMHRVHLDPRDRTVSFERPGVEIDLGGIGKGFAIDEAATILREAGVTQAFLHGGTSTIYALGTPPDAETWPVALPYPDAGDTADPDGADVLAVVPLVDEALSVSAVWGKSFEADGTRYGHVLDPRTGTPVDGAVLAAVAGASATETDALSTALLVLVRESATALSHYEEPLRALVVCPVPGGDHFAVYQRNMPLRPGADRIDESLL